MWVKLNLILVLLTVLLLLLWQQLPDENLRLVFCNVGQGDAILVSYQNQQILVDAGPDNRILSCLGRAMPFWDRTIELAVLTHVQADHLTGLIEVIRRYRVEKLATANLINDTPEFWQFQETVKSRGLAVVELVRGDRLSLGPVKLTVLWPAQSSQVLGASQSVSDLNAWSTVLAGEFGQFEFVLTGDIRQAEEAAILSLTELSSVEVLKLAHHGSKTSSSEPWLQALSPQLAVVSVGQNNRFGHPTQEVLDRLEALKIKLWRTDQQGTIVITSNGILYSYESAF